LGNKFFYACAKEVCCLWAQPCSDTFHKLLIVVEVLCSQLVLQVGKQVVVARSEIRVVRRVVKQLSGEMLKQCLRAGNCIQMWIVMEEHYAGCQHSTPFVLNDPTQFFSVSQYTCDIIVVPCCMDSTISTPFLSQKTVAVSFLAENVCLNFFILFGECMCIQCFDCSLVSAFTSETQVSSPCTMWLRNPSPSFWYGSSSLHSVHTHDHFWKPSCAKLVIA
jgi:hypothetical protein